MIMFGRGANGVGNPEVTDLERRAASVAQFGTVKEVNYTKARVRVVIGDEADDEGHLLTGWLPFGSGRARGDSEWHPPEVGEKVVVLAESGETQNGVVLPLGLYSDEDPAPGDRPGLWRKTFKDGARLEYDRDSGELGFTAMQKTTITVGDATITVQNGSIVMTAGGETWTLGSGGVASTGRIRGESGLEVTGAPFTHEGVDVGSGHRHQFSGGSGTGGIPV